MGIKISIPKIQVKDWRVFLPKKVMRGKDCSCGMCIDIFYHPFLFFCLAKVYPSKSCSSYSAPKSTEMFSKLAKRFAAPCPSVVYNDVFPSERTCPLFEGNDVNHSWCPMGCLFISSDFKTVISHCLTDNSCVSYPCALPSAWHLGTQSSAWHDDSAECSEYISWALAAF